jgi:trans-2,3-dihydro-3-hydroxyanthranilate isomerase
MQALSAELNYSETTFVMPPTDAANTALVRIFNRTAEMPFAGHPNVGTAFALALEGGTRSGTLRFEQLAGLVEVRLIEMNGVVTGAEIDAPLTLRLMETFPVEDVAACLSLSTDDIVADAHPPVRASVGVDFVLVAVRPEALARAAPDLGAFRRLGGAHPTLNGRLSMFIYALAGTDVRARMFAPLAGTWEDPATGSANAALAALRLHLSGADKLQFEAVQGVEMGRESRLSLRAWRTAEGVRASVGGTCVSMFRGSVSL